MSKLILKVSGEALKDANSLVSGSNLDTILKTIKLLKKDNHQIAIVVGGGNIFRGRENPDMNELNSATIGMLGTVMNAIYIKDYLEKKNVACIISTPFDFPVLINNYTNDELKQNFNNGSIVIFGGGFGKSGYSTDSGAVMACEILEADLIIKMTNVDGVYDSDPKTNKHAAKFDKLSFEEVINRELSIMDKYAITRCQERNIKILVVNFFKYEDIFRRFKGETAGTIIGGYDE